MLPPDAHASARRPASRAREPAQKIVDAFNGRHSEVGRVARAAPPSPTSARCSTKAQGHRRRRGRHDRRPARAGRHRRDEEGQARLLPEADGPLAPRHPADGRGREEVGRRHPGRGLPPGVGGDAAALRMDLGRRRRPDRPGRQLVEPPVLAAGAGPARRNARPCPTAWTGTSGSAPRRRGHTTPCYLPFVWRGWTDFGCGALGDMGCYSFDTIYRALEAHGPGRRRGDGLGPAPRDLPRRPRPSTWNSPPAATCRRWR